VTASIYTLATKKTGVSTAAATTALFTVTGGIVRVDALFGIVTTAPGAGAALASFLANPTGAGADTPLSIASASLALAPIGTILSVTGVPAAAPVINVGTGGGVGMTNLLYLNPCTIDLLIAVGDATGVIDFYCSWAPLTQGAVLL